MDRSRPDTAFPTGNGLIYNVGTVTAVRPDLRDSTGDRWYWHVRLPSRAGAVFRLGKSSALGRFGPAVSDDGIEYRWLCSEPRAHEDLTVEVPAGVAYACATIPYGLAQLGRFLDECRSRGAAVGPIGTSSGGIPVPAAVIGPLDAKVVLVVLGRLHACEAVASHVVEGIVDRFCETPPPGAGLVCVPAVDVEGLARGDQGKGRQPHDHNRDFGDATRLPETAAVRRLVGGIGPSIVAVDVHTPGLVGPLEEVPYLVSCGAAEEHDEIAHLAAELSAALDRRTSPVQILDFDGAWNTGVEAPLRSFSGWVRSRPSARLAFTVEYPNAVDSDEAVTQTTAHRFGSALVDTLAALLTE